MLKRKKTKGKTGFFGTTKKSLVVVSTLFVRVSVLPSLPQQETAIKLNDKVSILENPSVCELVNNMQSNNHTPRYAVTLFEEVSSSKTFSIIPFSMPKEIYVHYPPKTSARDCNRTDLASRQVETMSWIVWGNQNEIIKADEQTRHCLSSIPIRHIPEVQPLFVVHAENANINELGVVRTAHEDLHWKRTCFGTSMLVEYNKTCVCTQQVESVLVASNFWGDEVGHFTAETLPRIVSYLDLAHIMPVHLAGNDTAQIRMWLNYLNVTAIRGANICAKSVYVTSPSDCRGGAFMSNLILKTREMINPPHPNDKPTKVFIMNRDSRDHNREPVRNVSALVESMQNIGYKDIQVIKSSDSAFWSCIPCQLETYRNTKLFISSHGAGTMNLQFMPAHTFVVEIASLERPEEPFYSNTAQRAWLLGQRFYHYYWQTDDDSTDLDIDFFVSDLIEFAPPSMF